jgi:hypothetical protein
MIIPSIGEVPNWVILYSLAAAIFTVYYIRRYKGQRIRNLEMYIDASLLDIKNFFVWLSKKVRNIQIDTINADVTLMIIGTVIIMAVYLVVVIW